LFETQNLAYTFYLIKVTIRSLKEIEFF